MGPSEDFLSLTFKLTVKDDDGQESVDTVVVNVTDDLEATVPVADAGTLQTVSAGATVTLNGSASNDPESNSQTRISENHFPHIMAVLSRHMTRLWPLPKSYWET